MVSVGQESGHGLAGSSASGFHQAALQVVTGGALSSEVRLGKDEPLRSLQLLAQFILWKLKDP